MDAVLRDTTLRKRHEAYAGRPHAGPREAEGIAGARPGAATGRRVSPGEVEYIPYGPREPQSGVSCSVVATFGEVEAEYAAIRKGAGLLDRPHRGALRVGGSDRGEFLNRMLTADLRKLEAGTVTRSFWLNRKGRIDADLVVIELGDRLLVDLDIHQAAPAHRGLSDFVFADAVEIENASEALYQVAVHGPEALAVVGAAAGGASFGLEPWRAATVAIGGVEVVVARCDETGETGLTLIFPFEAAEAVWEALLGADETVGRGRQRVRPIGWYAFNIARVEAGTPLYNVDFGPTNLPHETGILAERVSFEKGCYPGQEVVARMENLGRPRQILVGLRMTGDRLPVAGDEVVEPGDGASGKPIGVITSSTLSPMLGATPIALAMIKSAHAEPGATVVVQAEGEPAPATVGPLRSGAGVAGSSR